MFRSSMSKTSMSKISMSQGSISKAGEDSRWMSLALQLAERGRYTTKPNPSVGCVIVSEGCLVGEGWHQRAGTAHAEVHALNMAGLKAKGATAYVTLEPCFHHGRTGPCCEALIQAGVSRLVFAMQDPNPLVAGQGLNALRHAGIVVDGPVLETAARDINRGFISRMERNRPWLCCKIATSIDGRSAMASGESQWITGTAARKDVQRLRACSSAIVTGIDSILQDNSRLNLRPDELVLSEGSDVDAVVALAPLRVVLDTHLRLGEATAAGANVSPAILDETAPTLILTSEASLASQTQKVAILKSLGTHVSLEALPVGDDGHLCLESVLALLAERACNQVLVEAGARLSGAFLKAGLIDELIVYQAPVLLGSEARPMMDLVLHKMSEKKSLKVIDQRKLGNDQRTIFRFK